MYSILTGDFRLSNFVKLIGAMHLKRDLSIFTWYLKHSKKNITSEIWNIDHYMYIMGLCNEEYIRAVVKTLSKMIAKHNPDAIVNFWNPFMNIAARINNIPLISVIQADTHPQSKGFIWWKDPPEDLPTPVPEINTILAENKLPTIHSTGNLSLGDLTLVLGIKEIDPLPVSANITYIGPMLLQDLNEKLPVWADELRNDQPLIWIYPGKLRYLRGHNSPFDGMVILQSCIKALKNKAVQIILSTGNQTLPQEVLPLPSNFRHTAFVPGLAMAKRSDLIIHHGGYGSSQTGLYAGTPAVIIPTFSERESNARRIAEAGAGDVVIPITNESGKLKTINIDELSTKIEQIISTPSFRENANKISDKMKRYGGASYVANLIEKFIYNDDNIETYS